MFILIVLASSTLCHKTIQELILQNPIRSSVGAFSCITNMLMSVTCSEGYCGVIPVCSDRSSLWVPSDSGYLVIGCLPPVVYPVDHHLANPVSCIGLNIKLLHASL